MDYEKLKEVIAKQIKENRRREITGPVLQAVLMAMVDSLGEVYSHTYTDEEKAQARANIDALSNYDGEITKEKLSVEVQAILNDVANKQNITDESLATIAKTIVGAINEVYKGGLKDASIATSKIKDGAITEQKLDTDLVNVIISAVQPTELASAIATALASYVAKGDIVDITGSATDKVMSQHGVTEAINGVTNKVTELEGDVANKQDINNTERVRFFQFSDFSEDGYINKSGELTQHANYRSTDFIQANPGGIIKYKDLRAISGYPLIALYDKEKNFIGSESGGSDALSGIYTIPENVFYVRFVCYNSLISYNPALVITDEFPKEDGTSEMVSPMLEDYVRHENLCNENIFIADRYVNASTGLLTDGTGYYKTSYLLKIRPSSKIFIYGIWSGNGVISVAYYDTDFTFLSSDSIKGEQNYNRGAIFTVPSTANYVRFVVRDLKGGYRGYVNTISAEIYSPSFKKQTSKLNEKLVVFLGDSITAGANVVPVTEGVVKPYPYLVAEATGLFPIVGATPGAVFKYTEGSEYSIPSQVELIRYTPDIIVIEGGVNDYASGRAFGAVDYGSVNMYSDTLDDHTFLGGLEKTFRLCATRFPGVPLLYVIATKARNYEWTANSQGQTYREYVDEIVKVCQKYGVKVVNLHDEANLVPQMPQYYKNNIYTYEGDNLHPTTLSYKTWYVNPVIQGLLSVCGEKK